MDEQVKEKWVAALRSGDYAQGQGYLRQVDEKFCCLGVLCDVMGEPWEPPFGGTWSLRGHVACLHRDIKEQLHLDIEHINTLVEMNDATEPSSFAEIADYIEANL